VSEGVNRKEAPKTKWDEVEWPLDVWFSRWSGGTKIFAWEAFCKVE
jgi:hypothetical protein